MKKPIEEIERIAAELVDLNIQDLTNLVEVLKNKYNLVPIQPTVSTIAPAKEEVKEEIKEKTSFNVVLINRLEGSDKLQAVKALNGVLNIGLKPCMGIMGGELPSTIKENCAISEAESIRDSIKPFGAEVEFR